MKKSVLLIAAMLILAGWIHGVSPGAGDFLLADTGSSLLVDTGSKFLVQ